MKKMTFKADFSKLKIHTTWEAINYYNHYDDEVKKKAQDFLFDYYFWELVQTYNEDLTNHEEYDWIEPNPHFTQRAYDHLNYLFQKD